MKNLGKVFILCLALAIMFTTVACRQNKSNANTSSATETENTADPEPSSDPENEIFQDDNLINDEKPELNIDGVKIIPPIDGIVGEGPTESLPSKGDDWKGVFIKDRIVKLDPYGIAKTEVTYALWKKVYDWATKDGNGYKFSSVVKGQGECPVTNVNWKSAIVWCNAYTEMFYGDTEHCVYKVSKNGAVLKDTSKVSQPYMDPKAKGFRLPTEAEWEYAARLKADGTLTPLSHASGAEADWNNKDATGKVAWYKSNSGSQTHIVGEKNSNALGLFDMSGNVAEWCFDGYDSIGTGTVENPQGNPSALNRILRGGCYYFETKDCIVGYRYRADVQNSESGFCGFRVAWSRKSE